MINQDLKTRVVNAIKVDATTFGSSAAKHATSIGINAAIYSRLMAGEHERVISDSSWISLARHYAISLKNLPEWKTAETPVFIFITEQLGRCQNDAISCILCDDADIGKTHTAKAYAKANTNAVYIDCSQVKSKQNLVRKIAKEFGVSHTGKYQDVYKDLIYYLNAIINPLIILDEAGDLNYDAFLELKALWNATERSCGWCMIGADGLKEKIRRAINNKKVGYTELFSRFGKRYQRITPDGKDELIKFNMAQAGLIIKANAPASVNTRELLTKTDSSLRRIYNEIAKLN